jgi:hypothetical protein
MTLLKRKFLAKKTTLPLPLRALHEFDDCLSSEEYFRLESLLLYRLVSGGSRVTFSQIPPYLIPLAFSLGFAVASPIDDDEHFPF